MAIDRTSSASPATAPFTSTATSAAIASTTFTGGFRETSTDTTSHISLLEENHPDKSVSSRIHYCLGLLYIRKPANRKWKCKIMDF